MYNACMEIVYQGRWTEEINFFSESCHEDTRKNSECSFAGVERRVEHTTYQFGSSTFSSPGLRILRLRWTLGHARKHAGTRMLSFIVTLEKLKARCLTFIVETDFNFFSFGTKNNFKWATDPNQEGVEWSIWGSSVQLQKFETKNWGCLLKLRLRMIWNRSLVNRKNRRPILITRALERPEVLGNSV